MIFSPGIFTAGSKQKLSSNSCTRNLMESTVKAMEIKSANISSVDREQYFMS